MSLFSDQYESRQVLIVLTEHPPHGQHPLARRRISQNIPGDPPHPRQTFISDYLGWFEQAHRGGSLRLDD